MSKKGVVNVHTLYQKVANETGIPVHEVEKAVKWQWRYVRQIMAEGNFLEDGELPDDMGDANIRLPYFGVFKVKPRRVIKLNNLDDEI